MPRPGQVLGLVGTNGIGKSTALKVLAGKLKPNLGRFDVSVEQQGWRQLQDYRKECSGKGPSPQSERLTASLAGLEGKQGVFSAYKTQSEEQRTPLSHNESSLGSLCGLESGSA
eukprot:888425-Pelagomonas_calceolata.AAC.1